MIGIGLGVVFCCLCICFCLGRYGDDLDEIECDSEEEIEIIVEKKEAHQMNH